MEWAAALEPVRGDGDGVGGVLWRYGITGEVVDERGLSGNSNVDGVEEETMEREAGVGTQTISRVRKRNALALFLEASELIVSAC